MKFIIGRNFHSEFKVLLDDGTDVTKDFLVTKFSVELNANKTGHTKINLTIIPTEIEMSAEEMKIRIENDFIKAPAVEFITDQLK